MAGLGFFGGLSDSLQAGMQRNADTDLRQQYIGLEQQRVQNEQQRFQQGQYMDLYKQGVEHMSEFFEQWKIAHPDGDIKQAAAAMAPTKENLKTLLKNLGQNPDTVEGLWAGMIASPPKTQTESAMARAKEGPLKQELQQSEIAKNQALAGNLSTSSVSDAEIDKIGTYQQAPPNTSSVGRRSQQAHALMAKVYEKYPDYNPTNYKPKAAAAIADVKADSAALTKLVGQREAIQTFEDTAVKNGDKLVELADKVDRTGVPIFEKWIRAGKQATGDPDVAAFNTQMTLYRAEVAKILTNPNMTGVLTDTARREVEEGLTNPSSAKQIRAIHELLKGDFGRRTDSLDAGIERLRGRLKGVVGTGKDDNAPKSQDRAPSGGKWMKTPLEGVEIREKP